MIVQVAEQPKWSQLGRPHPFEQSAADRAAEAFSALRAWEARCCAEGGMRRRKPEPLCRVVGDPA